METEVRQVLCSNILKVGGWPKNQCTTVKRQSKTSVAEEALDYAVHGLPSIMLFDIKGHLDLNTILFNQITI